MLIVRLRQAETALADGRLDEAFGIARSAEVGEHRRGQDLIGRLARAFIARGHEHLAADRLPAAGVDCENAETLAGNTPEVIALKSRIREAAAARQTVDRQLAGALGAAREHIRAGELSVGEGLLQPLEAGHGDHLRGEATARRQSAEAILSRAKDAVGREDWSAAVDLLLKARQLHSTNANLPELSSQAAARMVDRMMAAMNDGRLDQARCLASWLEALGSQSIEYVELRGALDLCTRSAAALHAGDYRRVIETLQQVRIVLPNERWVGQAVIDAQQAAEATERLRGGPTGMLMGEPRGEKLAGTLLASGQEVRERVPARATIPAPAAVSAAATRLLGPGPAAAAIPVPTARVPATRLMLHVDGVGSFLVLRERSVTIAPAGGSRQPDVGLLLDGAIGPVTIERADEDYFLAGGPGVTVNRVNVTRKLLANGDRIGLGNKCHIKFTVPNAASTSALLGIAGARMPGTDATRVILLADSIVIGPGPSAHVRCDDLDAPVVLHLRDGRLFCHAAESVNVDGRPADRQAGLPLGSQVRIGPLSMAVRAV